MDTEKPYRFIDLTVQTHTNQFIEDIRTGLTSTPKCLPVKHLYDAVGSELFEKITQDKDYYLTRAEEAILAEFSPEIVQQLESNTALVELGSGSAAKTRHLIEALLQKQESLLFAPIDISGDFLRENVERLNQYYPSLRTLGVIADYHDGLAVLAKEIKQPKLLLWLGSDIGHVDYNEAAQQLREHVVSMLKPGDKLLLGIDLKKSPYVINLAYGCTEQQTPIHTLSHALASNGLRRINQLLQGNFVLENFRYHCRYNDKLGCIEVYLKSMCDQQVYIANLSLQVTFAQGELIRIHTSYKYNNDDIQQLAKASGLQLQQQWFDNDRLFSVNLFSLLESSKHND
ncbi:MAG: L-histidine N(alpha)-methyltransferase [Mariprofundales bacterium]